jgi:light-regulated signal transduction histidine kinase (bacteriophytochrome)
MTGPLANADVLKSSPHEAGGREKILLSLLEDLHHTREALRKKTAELERSNQALEQFASVASHDLQEPLRKILMFGDRLKKQATDLGGAEQGYIARMQNAAARMQQLIEGVLSYSRVVRETRFFESLSLRTVVQEVLSDLEARILSCAAQIHVGPLPTLEVDAVEMRQLFQNLIGNALKFARKEVPPRLQIRSQTFPNGTVEITLKDNGIGFEEKYQKQIFQPFQRLHTREKYEGIGMGLAICQKIVAHHGGELTARSTLGKGSTFFIRLPRADSQERT